MLLTKLSYDHAGRLLTISKSISSTINGQTVAHPEQTLADNTYNELGQLQNKTEGPALETLAYDYNIRGWLLGVNRNYVNDAAINYFGFDLGYDKSNAVVTGATYIHQQYNGNIGGIIWKSKGDNEKRKYDFDYDNAKRLTGADFTQQFGNNWGTTDPNNAGNRIDFTVNNLTYDANGNIITQQQQGWKLGGSVPIDNMQYSYINNNSNRLLAVNDNAAGSGTLGDFNDKNTTLDDYTYDANGNLTVDKNKKIPAISYNHLNLPAQITVNNDNNSLKGTITYAYDAVGTKLSKTVMDVANNSTNTTLYISGFEYKNNELQQAGHEEGRIRYAKKYFLNGDSTYQYFYDYFLKDHLGNVRMVLTEQKDTTGYYATMELGAGNALRDKENALFANIGTSAFAAASVPGGYPTDNSLTNPNDYVAQLNGSGQKTGPAIVLKVTSGDMVDLAVKSFYHSQASAGGNTSALVDVLNSLAGGIVGVSGEAKGTLTQLSNLSTSPLAGALNSFRTNNNTDPLGKPKAYLNWILLDERFNYVSSYPQSGALPVGDAESLNTLGYSGINITKSGYLYIYVSNETQNWNVYFDDLAIKHYTGPILEETHYYPYGLTMAGISSKVIKSNYAENKFKFNGGSELNSDFDVSLYETKFRGLDPQIGRFLQIDPLDGLSINLTPYGFASNNPINNVDPLGAKDTVFHGEVVQRDKDLATTYVTHRKAAPLVGFYWPRMEKNQLKYNDIMYARIRDKQALSQKGDPAWLAGQVNWHKHNYKAQQDGRKMQVGAVVLIGAPVLLGSLAGTAAGNFLIYNSARVWNVIAPQGQVSFAGGAADLFTQKVVQGKSWGDVNYATVLTNTFLGGRNIVSSSLWESTGSFFTLSVNEVGFNFNKAGVTDFAIGSVGNLFGNAWGGMFEFTGVLPQGIKAFTSDHAMEQVLGLPGELFGNLMSTTMSQ